VKDKEYVLSDFLKMIITSWTYDKMTKSEKDRLNEMLTPSRVSDILKGTYQARWEILNGLYYAYLMGLGYTPIGWREEKEMNF
jgi:hypothetical protein